MMEVTQPIGSSELELKKINSSAVECLEDITSVTVQQNGIAKKFSNSLDEDAAKCLEDDDAMEQLLYSEAEDIIDPESTTNMANETLDSSNILIKDTVPQYSKGEHNGNSDSKNDTPLERQKSINEEESSELPPLSVQSSSEPGNITCADEDDTNEGISILDHKISVNEDHEAVSAVVNSAASDILEEDEENILLEADDDTEMGEPDETILLEEMDVDEECSTQSLAAIPIDDSSIVSAEITTAGDSSTAVVDESALSILNTAAVDIDDMTADESGEVIPLVEESHSGKTGTVNVDESVEVILSVEESKTKNSNSEETPVFDMIEEMVTSIADNLKANDNKQDDKSQEESSENVEQNPVSPELSDLIKFPDVDELVNDEKVNACDKSIVSELPIETDDNFADDPVEQTLAKEQLKELCETEDTVEQNEAKHTEDAPFKESQPEVEKHTKQEHQTVPEEAPSEECQTEVSDLIKFTSIVEREEIEEGKETEIKSTEECQGEVTDLIKISSVVDKETTEENGEETIESQGEVSDLIKFTSLVEQPTTAQNEEVKSSSNEETIDCQTEDSDLIKFTSVVEKDVTEESTELQAKPDEELSGVKDTSSEECQEEVSELIKFTSVTEVKIIKENENINDLTTQEIATNDTSSQNINAQDTASTDTASSGVKAQGNDSSDEKLEMAKVDQDTASTDTTSSGVRSEGTDSTGEQLEKAKEAQGTASSGEKAQGSDSTDEQLEKAKESDERLEGEEKSDSQLEKKELSDIRLEKMEESENVEELKKDKPCTETVLEKSVENNAVIDKSIDTEKNKENKDESDENEKDSEKSITDQSKDKNTDKLSQEDSATKKDEGEDEEDQSAPLEVCAQALQAADEEDLLEMMDEPERMDEDEGEEEPDDNSSESGSAKHTGDEIEAEEEAESPRIEEFPDVEMEDTHVDTEENLHIEEDDSEAAEGEPPKKRKCSVDIRESSVEKEVEIEKEKVEKVSEEPKPTEKSADDLVVEDTKMEETPEQKTAEKKSEIEEKIVSEEAPKKNEDEKEETVKQNKEEKKLEIEVTTDEKTASEADKKVIEKVLENEKSESTAKTEGDIKEDVKEKQTDDDSTKTVDNNKVEKDTSSEEDAKVSDKEDTKQMETKSKVNVNDEILIIDDDDDVPAAQEAKKETSASKRPCPDDHDEKENKDSAKKIRLSTDQSPAKTEEGKSEVKSDTIDVDKKEVKKSPLELIEPISIVLDPAPGTVKEKKPIKLEFMEKFKKPLEKMNRSDLEQFVLQKIVEGVAFKSTIAEMRTQLDAQDTLLQGYRQKVHDLNKQFKDLEMVHERVVKDLEKKNQHFITPVKITRAVGLQVSQPRFAAGNRPSIGSANLNSPRVNQVNRSPASTSTPGSSPNKVNSPQNNAQNRRQSYTRVGPVVINSKSPGQQQGAANRPGAPVLTKPGPAGSPATPINKSITPLQSSGSNSTPANAANQTQSVSTPVSSSVNFRKKPLQKFTPMRPPLSITQQVQQQQQTKQMQEQLMRQQIQDVQTGSTSGGSTPQSPAAQSPQGSPLTRTPEPSPTPVGVTQTRVAPVLMKKLGVTATKPPTSSVQIVNRQTNTTTTISTTATITRTPASNQSTTTAAAPAPTIDNSLIDLTDEDDQPVKPASKPGVQTSTTVVVPKPPITLLNGQQQQQQAAQRQQNSSLPPLVAIQQQQQQRLGVRPTLQQRPALVNGIPRPVLIQRPVNAANTVTRTLPTPAVYRQRLPNGQLDVSRRIVARPPVRQQAQQQIVTHTHPAPLPQPGAQISNTSWKQSPPRPSIRINNIETGIVISWTMDDLSDSHATIVSYQIYAYQETSAAPSVDMWRHVGDVKAMLLPMAVTLTQFQEGQRYHFAVRAVDEHQRVGQFSPPRTWNESTPAKA